MGVGDLAGAEDLYHRAAEAGESKAMIRLAEMRKNVGDLVSAEELYERAVEAGESTALIFSLRCASRLVTCLARKTCTGGWTTSVTSGL